MGAAERVFTPGALAHPGGVPNDKKGETDIDRVRGTARAGGLLRLQTLAACRRSPPVTFNPALPPPPAPRRHLCDRSDPHVHVSGREMLRCGSIWVPAIASGQPRPVQGLAWHLCSICITQHRLLPTTCILAHQLCRAVVGAGLLAQCGRGGGDHQPGAGGV